VLDLDDMLHLGVIEGCIREDLPEPLLEIGIRGEEVVQMRLEQCPVEADCIRGCPCVQGSPRCRGWHGGLVSPGLLLVSTGLLGDNYMWARVAAAGNVTGS